MSTSIGLDRNGPQDDEIQIIGIEFTTVDPIGRTVELAMFATNIIIPRARSLDGWSSGYTPRITFHTTDGDYQMDAAYMGTRPSW